MDVKGLYPAIIAKRAAAIVKDTIKESNIKFEGLDAEELGKYLRINMKRKDIEELGFQDILPQRVKKKRKMKKKKKADKNSNNSAGDILDFAESLEDLFESFGDADPFNEN